MHWHSGAAGLACALVAVLSACNEGSDRSSSARSDVGGAGRMLYLTYCEGCHGLTGAGDGPAAGSLRIAPPDLTRLWESYGTPLDRERLAEHIDGRVLTFFHAPREMPIWGDEFFEDVPPSTPGVEATKRRLVEVLIEYLETLQTNRQT